MPASVRNGPGRARIESRRTVSAVLRGATLRGGCPSGQPRLTPGRVLFRRGTPSVCARPTGRSHHRSRDRDAATAPSWRSAVVVVRSDGVSLGHVVPATSGRVAVPGLVERAFVALGSLYARQAAGLAQRAFVSAYPTDHVDRFVDGGGAGRGGAGRGVSVVHARTDDVMVCFPGLGGRANPLAWWWRGGQVVAGPQSCPGHEAGRDVLGGAALEHFDGGEVTVDVVEIKAVVAPAG